MTAASASVSDGAGGVGERRETVSASASGKRGKRNFACKRGVVGGGKLIEVKPFAVSSAVGGGVMASMLQAFREVRRRKDPTPLDHSPILKSIPRFFSCALLAFQGLLAFTTGGIAGAAGSYIILKSVWTCAQSHHDAANECITELRSLRGANDLAPPHKVRLLAPFVDLSLLV